MSQLSTNWFLEGLQDFEYKKYLLLAYLKSIKERFDATLLYPAMGQLVEHYQNLAGFYGQLAELQSRFPQKLTGIDRENFRLQYTSILGDDDRLSEVEDIVEYALPRVKKLLEEGRGIFEFIDNAIEIGEVGLLPLHRDEGYLLLRGGNSREVKAYQYQVTIFEQSNERFRSIRSELVGEFSYGLANTYESIKLDLIRSRRKLPNPATFFVCSQLEFPEEETFVPVAKRKFMRHLAGISA
jgi:hypothetical protein